LPHLSVGDLIAVKYLTPNIELSDGELVERWIHARVIYCDPSTWPLVRLADGQLTEVRPFMTWRMVSKVPRLQSVAA
jgi:hypothetical protein